MVYENDFMYEKEREYLDISLKEERHANVCVGQKCYPFSWDEYLSLVKYDV